MLLRSQILFLVLDQSLNMENTCTVLEYVQILITFTHAFEVYMLVARDASPDSTHY